MKNTFCVIFVFLNVVFVLSDLEKRDVHHKIIIKNSRPVRSHKTSTHHHKEHAKPKHKHHPKDYHHHYRDYHKYSDEYEDNDSAYDEPKYYKRPHHSYHNSEEYEMRPSVELSSNQGGWTPLSEIDLPQSHSKPRHRSPSTRFKKHSSPSQKLRFFDEDYNFSHDFGHKNKQTLRHYKNKKFFRSQRDLFGNNSYEVHETPRESSQLHYEDSFQALAPSFEMLTTGSEPKSGDQRNIKSPLRLHSNERKLNKRRFNLKL